MLKGIESVVPVANGGTGEVPMQPGLLTSIRDTFGGWRNPDEDAMTETTDPVGDAFRQALDGSDKDVEEDNDDEDDEIVWDPRYALQLCLTISIDVKFLEGLQYHRFYLLPPLPKAQ